MIIRKTFLFLAVLVLYVPALAFAQDVDLTSDGKVPGKPFVYLQEQIDNIVSSPWMISGSDISFDGNIGIGTTGPPVELEVNGTVAASAFSSTSPLIFETPQGTERMRIDDLTGNVGIGTTSPLAPFHVVSSVTWPTLPIFTENNHDSRTGAGINMRKSRGTPTLKEIVWSSDILGAVHFFGYDGIDYKNAASVLGIVEGLPVQGFIPGRLHFLTNDGTTDIGAVRMVINSSGNVGIGTTNPLAPFHVNASVSRPTLPLLLANSVNDQTGAGIRMRKSRGNPDSKEIVVNNDFLGAVHFFGYDDADYQRASSIAGRVDGDPGLGNMPGRLEFSTNNGTSILERMRIDNLGNVGIGTTSPNYPLEMGSGAHVTTGGVWTNASSREKIGTAVLAQ
ncbi:MAG: hypothetical protein ACE5GU_05355 [Candidatus Scalinduaceae bacterium]